MEKQRGMAFGFRKTATTVKKTGQMDRSLASILSSLLVYISFVTRLSKKQKITESIWKHPTVKQNAIIKDNVSQQHDFYF